MAVSKQFNSERKDLNEDLRDIWVAPTHSIEKGSPDEQIKHLRVMFESVEDMLRSPDYDNDLKKELSAACPEYMTVFLSAKRDLLRNDCGIVVTGETSAGKTTLVNQLVGKKLCTTGNCATTGKITRIRDSEKMEIKCYSKDDTLIKKKKIKDLKKMRSMIKRFTKIKKKDLPDVNYVDVHLPVPILKGNVIMVDTPGIGENERLDKILLDFLPHAVSFVFVVNAKNAGGIHEDRLSKILKTIMDNREKMPCFDPREVMIITTQWDIVDNDDSSSEDDNISSDEEHNSSDQDNISTSDDDISSSDDDISSNKDGIIKGDKEDQHIQTWNKIIENLENGWGWFDIENVFRVSLKQVKKGLDTKFTEEYYRFETVLKANIEKNKNKRVEFYYRFLKDFIRNSERGALTRLNMLKRSEDEQQRIINQNNAKIHDLQFQCKQKSKELVQYKTEILSMLAEKLYAYLHSSDGRKEILNPPGEKKICDVSYIFLSEEVPLRFQNGIKRWCKGEEVKTIIEGADAKLKAFVEVIESKLHEIEIDMIGGDASVPYPSPNGATIVAGILLLPLTLVFAILAAVLVLPIGLILSLAVNSEMRRKMANDIYDGCLKQVSMVELKAGFEKSFGEEYGKAIVHVFEQSLPNVIGSLLIMNEMLLIKHKAIKEKEESFLRLEEKIRKIQIATEHFERRDY